MNMKQFLKRRWVIPVGALVLVLAIGATAWAATGSTTESTAGPTGTTVAPQNDPAPTPGPKGGAFGCFGRGGFRGNDAQSQEDQQRRDAMLQLVRDKMTEADKATLDSLQAQAKTQQETLQKAAQDLRDTNEQIRSLVDKYLGVPSGTGSSSGSPSSTAAPTT